MNRKIINGIRSLSIDMINEAGSGHPGICLGAAPIMYTLFLNHLNFNKDDGQWINRDRFVLSAGHGSALLYSTLFYAGYPITLEELKTFRKLNSRLTGHPELNQSIGIETTTGPLGQGLATAVGMAISEEYLRGLLPEIFNYNTYVLVGDGDLMEGISYEAASLAGSLKLGKLIVLYDSNDISLDGSTKSVFEEDTLKRFEACGWHTEIVSNGEDYESLDKAIIRAKTIIDKPSFIKVKTIIGLGSEFAGTNKVHGKPLSLKDIDILKQKMGVNQVPFYVSKESATFFRDEIEKRTNQVYNSWVAKYNTFMSTDNPNKKILSILETKELSINLKSVKIHFEENQTEELRITNQKLMNLIGDLTPLLIGGCADVAESTKVYLTNGGDFKITSYTGKNIHFGVRENLMSAVLNGLALSGLRPFGSTFLTFSDYLKPGLRLSALMNLPVINIFTHDSITIGEDGPTHQPIEQLASLRSIPNMTVFRPADVKELVGAWDYAINSRVPVSIVVSKDAVPEINNSSIENTEKGAYIIKQETDRLSGIIIATGTEVHEAIKISEELRKKGINVRVISMPSIELFNKQDKEYRDSLLPIGSKIIVLEASNDSIWNEFVYNKKYLLTLNNFGKSGSKQDVLQHFGFNFEALTIKIENLLK